MCVLRRIPKEIDYGVDTVVCFRKMPPCGCIKLFI